MQRTDSTLGALVLFMFATGASGGCSKARNEASAEREAPAETQAAPDLRVPDLDLDAKDPAQDYVGRYVRATKRYGDDATCARLDRSKLDAGRRVVPVRGRARCGSADLHDEFVVDVAADRLALGPGSNGGPLAAWPDGSAPDAEGHGVQTLVGAKDWASPVVDAMNDLGLSPSRVEVYGRGTYRIVSLAGWTEPVAKDAPREGLRAVGKKLCAANGESFALLGGGAPYELARIRCPNGDTEWESLRALGASAR
jgi:hypothetical protein